nr:hypothetical protein KPDKLGBK_00022 [uncultured bacterium]
MKNTLTYAAVLAATLGLTACDSDDNESSTSVESYGPYSTGSSSEPVSVYFDLETMSEVSATEDWDIEFNRTSIFLNTVGNTPVSMYFTGNNDHFYDSEGTRISSEFVDATPENEVDDFINVTASDMPEDSEFLADSITRVLDGYYNYDFTTHQITAADNNYFIVDSDSVFSKYRVSDLTQDAFTMTNITLEIANQSYVGDDSTAWETEFSVSETQLYIDLATECGSGDMVYVDLSTASIVLNDAAWDLSFTCNDDNSGAGFSTSMNLAADATALQDFNNSYAGIGVSAKSHYGFVENESFEAAFKTDHQWYTYAPEGGIAHGIYSQYGVYLIKTDTATYKFQITSYYDTDSEGNLVSGSYSFNAEAL